MIEKLVHCRTALAQGGFEQAAGPKTGTDAHHLTRDLQGAEGQQGSHAGHHTDEHFLEDLSAKPEHPERLHIRTQRLPGDDDGGQDDSQSDPHLVGDGLAA